MEPAVKWLFSDRTHTIPSPRPVAPSVTSQTWRSCRQLWRKWKGNGVTSHRHSRTHAKTRWTSHYEELLIAPLLLLNDSEEKDRPASWKRRKISDCADVYFVACDPHLSGVFHKTRVWKGLRCNTNQGKHDHRLSLWVYTVHANSLII